MTQDELAQSIVAAMRRMGYQVSDGPGEMNMVAIEGMNYDGTPNNNAPNVFNDRRLLIRFENGQPKIVVNHTATTEPGKYYTVNPINRDGAARIQFGQYARAWAVGMHHAGKPSGHEAMVQAGNVTVCRDMNKDYKRAGDKTFTGLFGINWHGGYNFPDSDIKTSSAGCIVTPQMRDHQAFMAAIKTDPRYLANRRYLFTGTIMPVAALSAVAGPQPSSVQGASTSTIQVGRPPADVFEAKAPIIISDLMNDFGVKDFQAAGVCGNLGHESGGLVVFQERAYPHEPPTAAGRGGWGWEQWTGPRRRQFFAYCAQNHLDPKSDEANYGFLKLELESTEKHSLDLLKQTRTLEEATRSFEVNNERAGVAAIDSRIRYAKRALQAYKDHPRDSSPTQVEQNIKAAGATGLGTGGGAVVTAGVHQGWTWWQWGLAFLILAAVVVGIVYLCRWLIQRHRAKAAPLVVSTEEPAADDTPEPKSKTPLLDAAAKGVRSRKRVKTKPRKKVKAKKPRHHR